jgi:hypothetical protein
MRDASAVRRPAALGGLVVVLLLGAYLVSQYGYAWHAPFINDDYIFLDQTRHLSFLSLWEPHEEWVGRYYRPWARELHYWALQRLFGAREGPFHAVGLGLWLGVLWLYYLLARRLAGTRGAGVATAGVAALAAWGLPVVWIAGAQDLWMMLFALASLWFVTRGRVWLAALTYALALLSKETAALLPAIALAYAWRVERRPPGASLRRLLPMLAVGVLWAAFHPQLGGSLWHASAPQAATGATPGPARTVLLTLLSTFNLDALPRPEFGWRGPLVLGLVGAVLLAGLLVWALRDPRGAGRDSEGVAQLAPVAGVWALAGWLPLLAPSVGWHAHYGLFGVLGAWLLLGALLARRRTLAVAVVVALALLRSSRAATVSHDWGDEWYQRRAAEFLSFMRRDLRAKVPVVPPHTRFYFVDVPSDVGFLPGDGPALRVWYDDSTLSGGLFSAFRARPPESSPGRDFFFRYDSTAGWMEIRRGAEDVTAARAANPRWREHHERLAVVLARGGDWAGTAAEYAKLAGAFPDDVTYAYYAGLASLALGDSATARAWLARAAGLPDADREIQEAASELGAHPATPPGAGR